MPFDRMVLGKAILDRIDASPNGLLERGEAVQGLVPPDMALAVFTRLVETGVLQQRPDHYVARALPSKPAWTAEHEETQIDVAIGRCKVCDKPIVYDESDSRDDSQICRRTHPFCLNHDHKVDWRARYLAVVSNQ